MPTPPRFAPVLLLAGGLLASACADAPFSPAEQSAAAPAAATTATVVSVDGSYTVSNGTTSELVSFTGRAHFLVRASPTDPYRFGVTLENVRGLGATTGATYSLTGHDAFEVAATYPGEASVYGFFRVQSPTDPCAGCPAQFLPALLSVALDGQGRVLSASALVTAVPEE